mmetsp:Transcript_543/g.1582  ORF Transcript_543/g.1582 Transcript_543/m.1582 type:complete len:200 (-) Transcript_543:1240-1839(-)
MTPLGRPARGTRYAAVHLWRRKPAISGRPALARLLLKKSHCLDQNAAAAAAAAAAGFGRLSTVTLGRERLGNLLPHLPIDSHPLVGQCGRQSGCCGTAAAAALALERFLFLALFGLDLQRRLLVEVGSEEGGLQRVVQLAHAVILCIGKPPPTWDDVPDDVHKLAVDNGREHCIVTGLGHVLPSPVAKFGLMLEGTEIV